MFGCSNKFLVTYNKTNKKIPKISLFYLLLLFLQLAVFRQRGAKVIRADTRQFLVVVVVVGCDAPSSFETARQCAKSSKKGGNRGAARSRSAELRHLRRRRPKKKKKKGVVVVVVVYIPPFYTHTSICAHQQCCVYNNH